MSPRDKTVIKAGRVDSPHVTDLVPEEAAALVDMKKFLECVLLQKTYSPMAKDASHDDDKALPEMLDKELTVSGSENGGEGSGANTLSPTAATGAPLSARLGPLSPLVVPTAATGGSNSPFHSDINKFADISAMDHDFVRGFCDDYCVLRYLRAREWNLEKAFGMLAETLRWRWTKRPELIKYEQVEKLAKAGSIYPNGFDKAGHPVMYMRARRDPPGTTDEKLDQILFTMEQGVRSMDASKGVEKFVYIIDLAGFSVTQAGADPKLAQAWITILQNHYPERLKLVCVVDSGIIFTGFWNIISYFIDTETRKKMHFITKTQFKKELSTSEVFDVQHVEAGYGGELQELISDEASEKYLASLKAQSKVASGGAASIGSRAKSHTKALGSLFG